MADSSSLLAKIATELEKLKAADAADLLLSPFINQELLIGASTEAGPTEAGPTNWLVNRSDIYDESLEKLLKHPSETISGRAAEKIKLRRATITTLTPPDLPGSLEEIPEHSVEDFLGHPLCPFEAMLYFSQSSNEDFRASSALSLTRRVLEHPPNWEINLEAKRQIVLCFSELLLSDPSSFVRAYTARVPLIEKATIKQAADKEEHPFVLGRVLQHPARELDTIESVVRDEIRKAPFVSRVLAFDSELPDGLRKSLLSECDDPLSALLHEWHLKNLS